MVCTKVHSVASYVILRKFATIRPSKSEFFGAVKVSLYKILRRECAKIAKKTQKKKQIYKNLDKFRQKHEKVIVLQVLQENFARPCIHVSMHFRISGNYRGYFCSLLGVGQKDVLLIFCYVAASIIKKLKLDCLVLDCPRLVTLPPPVYIGLTGKGRDGTVTLTLIVVLIQHFEKTLKASANARTFLLIGLKLWKIKVTQLLKYISVFAGDKTCYSNLFGYRKVLLKFEKAINIFSFKD